MSFVLEALRNKPQGLWLCDGTSPFTDASGYDRTATASSVAQGLGLVNGAAKSLVVNNTVQGTYASNVFKQGSERQAFSLEAWVLPQMGTEQQILGNSGSMDGLTINGTVVSFVTKYLSSGECRASFDIQQLRNIHVVGVHLFDKNQLYIDGVLVDEAAVAEDQKIESFGATTTNLTSGASSPSRNLLINGVGVYADSLTSDAILRHYNAGRDSTNDLLSFYNVKDLDLSTPVTNILFKTTFSNSEDWEAGVSTRMAIENDMLVPEFVLGASVPATWTTSVDLYNADSPNTIQSVNINWDGIGVVVEASIDGVTWETVQRNINLTSITAGFDPTEKELSIRLSYPGGVVDDQSYLRSLTITALKSSAFAITDTMTATYVGQPDIGSSHPAIEMSNDWGAILASTGDQISIGTDTSGDFVPRTAEIWFKVNANTNVTLFDARAVGATTLASLTFSYSGNSITTTGATVYANGTVGPTTPARVGEWQVWHIVGSANMTQPLLLNSSYTGTNKGAVQIGKVVLYDTALTATQISEIIAGYTGAPVTRFNDSNTVVGVSESATPVNIYAHDWSITATG